MKSGERKKIKGFIVKENILDKQGDIFTAEVCQKIEDQLEKGNPIFKDFNLTQSPIGRIDTVKYIQGEGIEIKVA